jgi:hypothetical protein
MPRTALSFGEFLSLANLVGSPWAAPPLRAACLEPDVGKLHIVGLTVGVVGLGASLPGGTVSGQLSVGSRPNSLLAAADRSVCSYRKRPLAFNGSNHQLALNGKAWAPHMPSISFFRDPDHRNLDATYDHHIDPD